MIINSRAVSIELCFAFNSEISALISPNISVYQRKI